MAHRTPSGKTSDAWKSLERAWAKCLADAGFKNAKRISRAGNIGESDHDVNLPEIPTLKSDCKYKQGGWSHHSIFKECEKKYVKGPGDFLVMPTKSGGEQGFLVTIRGDVLAGLLAKAFMGNKKSSNSLGCPRCGTEVSSVNISLDLAEYDCPSCKFEFIAKQLRSEITTNAPKEKKAKRS